VSLADICLYDILSIVRVVIPAAEKDAPKLFKAIDKFVE